MGMTATENNQIPLLDKISKKALRRQKAQDDHTVTFDTDVGDGHKKRSELFNRTDSVIERYGRVGEASSVRQYNVELLQATEERNYDKCQELLEKGVDVNARDEESGFTALHIAARNDSFDILRLLLEKGANCNAQDNNEQAPLHLAVKKDHIQCCHLLLDCKALHINIHNKIHDTPLHYAAKEGRYEVCQILLGHQDIKVNAKNKKGMNPLHIAAQENQATIMKLLLDNSANWKQQDSHSYLPLHYAAQKGYERCCEILISNMNDEDREKQLRTCLKDGKTPLMLAAKWGHHKCCEVMQYGNIKARDREGNTALHYAAQGGFDYTVTELLNAGADPNTQNKKGSAPVLEAAGKKKFGCLRILAEQGANLTVCDKQEKNVLHYAAEKNAVEALRFLLNYPELVKIVDNHDINLYTPLHLAIKKDADECAVLLLEKGASPTKQCASGMTPLHLAADKGFISVCEVLLAKKEVQVSQENHSKVTPLHLAAVRGSLDVCQMLIRKGARLTAVDSKGRTALHVASAEGHSKVVKFLSKKGIPQRTRDDTGSIALHLAASKGSLACCKVLVEWAKGTCWEKDQNGNLPLDKAFKESYDEPDQESLCDQDKVFRYLLEHLSFKENQADRMLRIHKYMDIALKERRVIIIDAIVSSCWWKAGISGKNGHQCQNFRSLVESYPHIALKLQEKCVRRNEHSSKVTYDFRLFEDNYYIPSASDALASCPCDEKTNRVKPNAVAFTEDGLQWKRNHPLTLMITHQRHQLLQHPLTKAWLLQKWRSYIYIIFLILLLVEILFTVCLVSFMGITDNWLQVQKNCNLSQEQFSSISEHLIQGKLLEDLPGNVTSENRTQNETGGYQALDLDDDLISQFNECNKNVGWKRLLWASLSVLTSLTLLLELNYAWRLRKEYFLQAEHILQVLKIVFTIVVLVPRGYFEFHYIIINVGNWQCGIVALLLTWLHLINTLNQLPMLSVFMPLTGSFAKSFFKVVFYIIMIVFVFAFIFHLLLRNQGAFSTVPQALVKTIVWMLGDLAYDDTFLADNQELHYPVMVNLFFVMFVTVLGGFIANLVITQPANKLDNFRDKASFHRAASRTMLFLKLDVCFPFFRKRRTVGSYVDDESGVDYSFLTKKLLMLDTKEEKQPDEGLHPIQAQLEELNNQCTLLLALHNEHREEVRDLKYQLDSLSKALFEQKQL